MFDYPLVRALTMWVASGVCAASLLLLSIDVLGSGEMIFKGLAPYLMLGTIFIPLLASTNLASSAAEVAWCSILGYLLGVLLLTAYLYLTAEVTTDFFYILRVNWWFALEMFFTLGILILAVNMIGLGLNHVSSKLARYWRYRP